METVSLSIAKLKEILNFSLKGSISNNFIVLNKMPKSETVVFQYPCRLDAIVFALCIAGKSEVIINLKEHVITKNMLVVNTPQNIFQINNLSEDTEIQLIAISSTFMDLINIKGIMPLYLYFQDNPSLNLQPQAVATILNMTSLLTEVVSREYEHSDYIIRGLISSLIYWISDIITDNNKLFYNKEFTFDNRQELVFEKFMKLLSEHHRNERLVSFYAEKLNYSVKHFTLIIKNVSGKSAAKWIDDFVILEAKNLLRYSDMSIQEIAYHLNFPTQSFFGRYFKRLTGVSPKVYRNQ